ncbi:hypothetical protein HBHAL_2616 [Halobacillus halophilus DSM 2266]|uniref:Uncharacterized protein n=1 Tax=Halobacillus halophilus (strain ATCC 35676 / DSM 2266 / JCM 20832 / KCTC 3685 / LMG 17431 / NBRC 102448 / NCIMB 2269) TaxID=866895 RepID=I0JLE4_HALH3|nr:hypothetical protein HBHAL_2616 [Halobacillus halophilus DSM 2266]
MASLFLFVVVPLLFLTVISLLVNVKRRTEKIENKLNKMYQNEE